MNIYPDEVNAGLTELLSATSSIVYASLAEKSISSIKKNATNKKALAGLDDSDLYYVQSILVTSSWNKNDDIFDSEEIWAAKATPMHKPTNLEHNEGTIVGHITSNWPMTEEGIVIDENTDVADLPKKFHILTGSVIYRGYTDSTLRERTDILISEIESGSKYVSMECFFKGFDYGIIDKTTGSYSILSRNEKTAYLTQHLRAYGGMGEHENYQIGRVLRNITFSGKGFVDRPANPDSIILTKDNLSYHKEIASDLSSLEKKDDFINKGVIFNQANIQETIMSEETQITEPLAEQVPIMSDHEIAANEAILLAATLTDELAQARIDVAAKDLEVSNLKQEIASQNEAIAKMNKTLEEYAAKDLALTKKAKKDKRVAQLVDNGVDSEAAISTVDKLDSLDDSSFDEITSLLAGMPLWLKKKMDDKKKMKEDTATKSDELIEEENVVLEDISASLENVETNIDVALSVSLPVESEVQNTRAALVDYICARLGKTLNNNKGE